MEENYSNLFRLGVGEVIICNRDTKGKFQQIPEFTGKSIIGIGGGEDKTYIIEEKDKISSEVKSIQTKENFRKFNEIKSLKSSRLEDNAANNNNTNDEDLNNDLEKKHSKFIEELNNENNDLNINSFDDDNESKSFNDTLRNNTNNNFNKTQEKNKQIIQIVKGKHQLLKLVANGKVYSSGESYYGVVGLGGAASSSIPLLIPNLENIKIKQISCGSNHSLALSVDGDLYSWGMGFEGQLGLTSQYKVASSPRYVKYFYKNPVKFISCGTNNSFCITSKDSYLYGWGENKLGQLGLGDMQIIERPTLIKYEEGTPCIDVDNSFNLDYGQGGVVNMKKMKYETLPLKASFVSAGYAHTAVVTDEGPKSTLMTMGLNIYGQLGLGHTQTTFKPQKVTVDDNNNSLGKVIKVGCNVTGTFIIVDGGNLYSCGSGDIGHGEVGVVKFPRLIYDQRIYSEIFCNNNSVVCFCPLKIISVSPNFGPCTGNTILSIIGSALKEFPKLSVRFDFNGIKKEVKANFDKLSKTIFVKTPNFIENCPNMQLPAKCKVLVTFDGAYFTEYKDDFLIYSNANRKPIALTPKCGPIEGGSEMKIQIDLKGIEEKYLFQLTVGFQAKPLNNDANDKKKLKMNKRRNSKQNDVESSRISKYSKISSEERSHLANNMNYGQDNNQLFSMNNEINPLDMHPNNPHLDKANWYCTGGVYENEFITCKIPKIDGFNQNTSEYSVDISLNGQQFSGHPLTYRFYDISFKNIEPKLSPISGGAIIKLYGDGLFDTISKKAKISSSFGERFCDIQWERNDKSFLLVSNPLSWIVNDDEILNSLDPVELFENHKFDISITMNNSHYIYAGSYKYYDIKILRITYANFDKLPLDQRQKIIKAEEVLTNEEKITLGFIPNNIEDKKKKDEYIKKLAEEDNLIKNSIKRPYSGIYIYGNFFPKHDPRNNLLKVKFICEERDIEVEAFYKNKYKIGVMIPEIYLSTDKVHQLIIAVSLNGQNYSITEFSISYQAAENLPLKFEDYLKLEEEDAKGNKGKKKK